MGLYILFQTNILINDKLEASITDFGLSRVLGTTGFTTDNVHGTFRWMAYELIALNDDSDDTDTPPATIATDVWAFAMTAIEVCLDLSHTNLIYLFPFFPTQMKLFTSRLPFHHLRHDSAVILTITKHGLPPRENSPEIKDDVWSVLKRCWTEEPHARPSMASLALFFDLTSALATQNEHLAEAEIAQLLSSNITPTTPTTGKPSMLGRIRSLGRSSCTADRQRQRQSDINDRHPRRFSLPLPGRASRKQVDVSISVTTFYYHCNWPKCPEGFDTLGECQAHEMGHRRGWERNVT